MPVDPEKTSVCPQGHPVAQVAVRVTGSLSQQEDIPAIGYVAHTEVPSNFVSWSTEYPGYEPIGFTDKTVLVAEDQVLADSSNASAVDFSNRSSFVGYSIDPDTNRPLNPRGRTGVAERGLLWKWGPNHAADPVVIATDNDGNRKILLIKRKDTGEWALPGGMVDPGEHVTIAAKRELGEESGVNLYEASAEKIYSGYVDDPRNTDNAWVETVASLIEIDHTPETNAGDDAAEAVWFNVDSIEQLERETGGLYASHADIIQGALDKLGTR